MLLVVFGAGASYDSDPSRPPPAGPEAIDSWRPPLANELFGRRFTSKGFQKDFPQLLPVVARLERLSATRPLEGLLGDLQREAAQYPRRHSELAAVRYYLQRVVWEAERFWLEQTSATTSYLALLDRIQRARGGRDGGALFATFNYDRLFEKAASYYISSGTTIHANQFETIGSYIERADFPLIKLHGSIDWGYRVTTDLAVVEESGGHVWQIAAEVIRRTGELDLATDVEKTVDRPPQPMNGKAYLPAIAIPLDNKREFICPESHLTHLKEALPQVTALLLIGWRGADDHFRQLLREHLGQNATVAAVCGELADSRALLEGLRAEGIGATHIDTDGGFADYVVGDAIDHLIGIGLAT